SIDEFHPASILKVAIHKLDAVEKFDRHFIQSPFPIVYFISYPDTILSQGPRYGSGGQEIFELALGHHHDMGSSAENPRTRYFSQCKFQLLLDHRGVAAVEVGCISVHVYGVMLLDEPFGNNSHYFMSRRQRLLHCLQYRAGPCHCRSYRSCLYRRTPPPHPPSPLVHRFGRRSLSDLGRHIGVPTLLPRQPLPEMLLQRGIDLAEGILGWHIRSGCQHT
ncbi:hypothetical protein JMJ78_0000885, partial [Colletotrichum scovillei]